MGTLFGAIICFLTFVGFRSFTVDLKKDWDLVLVQAILVTVFYLIVDSIFFPFQ
jgi:hypothetical protein